MAAVAMAPMAAAAAEARAACGGAARWAVAAAGVVALMAAPAIAMVGTHAPSIATFDVRASSLGLSLHQQTAGAATLQTLTYHTAFTSTTGRVSSQFGVHALRISEPRGEGYGFSATAATMWTLPAQRFDNGVARSAFRFWLGVAPSALFGAVHGRVFVPVTPGAALTFSPLRWLSISPWAELAVGLDVNAEVDTARVELDPAGRGGEVELSADKVEDILKQAVRWNAGGGFGWRVGLEVAVHLGDAVDLALLAGGGKLGVDVGWQARLAVVYHWDDVVPALLPDRCLPPPMPRPGRQRPPPAPLPAAVSEVSA